MLLSIPNKETSQINKKLILQQSSEMILTKKLKISLTFEAMTCKNKGKNSFMFANVKNLIKEFLCFYCCTWVKSNKI